MRDWLRNQKASGKLPLVDKKKIGPSYVQDSQMSRYESEGAKIPTAIMVEYDGRKRRVYNAYYPDVSNTYIIVHGRELFFDEATDKKVFANARH